MGPGNDHRITREVGSGIGGEAMGLPLHKPDGFIFWAKPKFMLMTVSQRGKSSHMAC